MNAHFFSYSNVELPLNGCDDSGCYLPHQSEATDDSSYDYIQDEYANSSRQIELVWNEPQEHSMDSEWNADAYPKQQVVDFSVLHVNRLEQKEEHGSQENREDYSSEEDAYTFHVVHRPF